MDKPAVIDATRRWISEVVIRLDLCPFARRVFDRDLIRYVVSEVADEESLHAQLADELRMLASTSTAVVETAVLIHPLALLDFLNYNDFLDGADVLLRRLDLWGTIQLAGFHPDYRFAGTEPEAVENYTNRSPYPMIHLLREESVSRVADDPAWLLDIPQRNIATLRRIGRATMREQLKSFTRPSL